MRNLKKYPVTKEEVIEALEYTVEIEKSKGFGSIRLMCLKVALELAKTNCPETIPMEDLPR